MQEEKQQAQPSSSSWSQWDGWWANSWWDESCQWTERVSPRWLFSQFKWLRWSTFSGHPSGRWKHPHRTSPHLSPSCTSSFITAITFVSQDFGICILSLSGQVSALCFVRKDILESCWCSVIALRIVTAVLGEEKLLCVHTAFLRCAPQATQWFCGYRKTYTFHKIWAQVREQTRWIEEIYKWEAVKPRRFLREECLKKNTEQLTASTSFNTFRSVFWHYGNHESDDCASATCQQGATTCSRRIVRTRKLWKKYLENGVSGVEDQKKNFWRSRPQRTRNHGKRRSICVILLWSEIQNRSLGTSNTGKRSRQSSIERIFQKLRCCDDARHSRYSESIWRTIARKWKKGGHKWLDSKHEMLFVVNEAMLHEHQVFFKQRKIKEFVKSQMQSEHSHAQCKLSKNLTWSRSSTRANYTTLGIPGGTIEKTSCKLRISWWRL